MSSSGIKIKYIKALDEASPFWQCAQALSGVASHSWPKTTVKRPVGALAKATLGVLIFVQLCPWYAAGPYQMLLQYPVRQRGDRTPNPILAWAAQALGAILGPLVKYYHGRFAPGSRKWESFMVHQPSQGRSAEPSRCKRDACYAGSWCESSGWDQFATLLNEYLPGLSRQGNECESRMSRHFKCRENEIQAILISWPQSVRLRPLRPTEPSLKVRHLIWDQDQVGALPTARTISLAGILRVRNRSVKPSYVRAIRTLPAICQPSLITKRGSSKSEDEAETASVGTNFMES